MGKVEAAVVLIRGVAQMSLIAELLGIVEAFIFGSGLSILHCSAISCILYCAVK